MGRGRFGNYEVNGTWYPGYIAAIGDLARSTLSTKRRKYKVYEEPIKKAEPRRSARGIRRARRSGPRPPPKKKKPRQFKPAAKSPAKKKTVATPAARGLRGEARRQEAGASPASMMAHRRPNRSPTQAREEAGREGEEPSKKPTAKKSKRPARKKPAKDTLARRLPRQQCHARPACAYAPKNSEAEPDAAPPHAVAARQNYVKLKPPGSDDLLLGRRGHRSERQSAGQIAATLLGLHDQVLVAELRPTCAGTTRGLSCDEDAIVDDVIRLCSF